MRAQRKKAVQYNDSESDSEFLMPECETEAPVASGVSMIVEKVLGRKMMKNPDEVNKLDELFFIKWKKVCLCCTMIPVISDVTSLIVRCNICDSV